MEKYELLTDYDLLAKVLAIESDLGGRKHPLFDGYRGQFFWHINGVDTKDWDTICTFKGGEISPGSYAMCKIKISQNLLKYSGGNFRKGAQFCLREGWRIIAVGIIEANRIKNY